MIIMHGHFLMEKSEELVSTILRNKGLFSVFRFLLLLVEALDYKYINDKDCPKFENGVLNIQKRKLNFIPTLLSWMRAIQGLQQKSLVEFMCWLED